jgi:hypothetical protein
MCDSRLENVSERQLRILARALLILFLGACVGLGWAVVLRVLR